MYKKIMKVLNDPEITFTTVLMKEPYYGINEGDTISINLIQTLVPTITHEILHELYPELSERKILLLEEVVFGQMTFAQKRAIYKKFMARCIDATKEKKF